MDHNFDPPTRPGEAEPERAAQRIARLVLAAMLVLLGLWILHRYLAALGWAAVLAIALWPLYRRLVRALGGCGQRVLASLLLTLATGLVFIVPFVYAAVEAAREAHVLAQYLVDAQRTGIPVPGWISELPGIGYPLEEWWRTNLSDPKAAEQLLGRIYSRVPAESARDVAGQIIHRLILFGFTLLTLFFLLRDGTALSRQLIELSDRVLGAQGERVGQQMVQAVLGTVNGLVFVGLGEGVLLGIGGGGQHRRWRRRPRHRARGRLRSGSLHPAGSDRRGDPSAVSVGAARYPRRIGNLRDFGAVSRPGHHGRADLAMARMDRPPSGRRRGAHPSARGRAVMKPLLGVALAKKPHR